MFPFGRMSTIFMLHRVHPFEVGKLAPNEEMKVSPEFLDAFITQSKRKGYSFISLDELSHDIKKNSLKKTFVLTLDDGYLDNYTRAFSLFKAHQVPFAIYVTTSFPDREAILWWYELEDLILQNSSLAISGGEVYSCRSQDEKIKAFMSIREKIIALPVEGFEENLKKLFSGHEINWRRKVEELAMSWGQIREIAQDPLATIGAHTINHLRSASLSEDAFRNEVLGSKSIIESHIGKNVQHFCYPFGSRAEVTSREFALVRDMGFKTATTTRTGDIFRGHIHHLEALPRRAFTDQYSWGQHYVSHFKQCLLGRTVVE